MRHGGVCLGRARRGTWLLLFDMIPGEFPAEALVPCDVDQHVFWI